MKKRPIHSKFSPETLAKEWRQAVVFLEKMEFMARTNQGPYSPTRDQQEAYNTIIGHAQEASAHLQAMFDALGRLKLENPTTLH